MDNQKKLGEKKKGRRGKNNETMLMKVTKRVLLPSVIILLFIFVHLLCCGVRGERITEKNILCDPLTLKGKRE